MLEELSFFLPNCEWAGLEIVANTSSRMKPDRRIYIILIYQQTFFSVNIKQKIFAYLCFIRLWNTSTRTALYVNSLRRKKSDAIDSLRLFSIDTLPDVLNNTCHSSHLLIQEVPDFLFYVLVYKLK